MILCNNALRIDVEPLLEGSDAYRSECVARTCLLKRVNDDVQVITMTSYPLCFFAASTIAGW